MGREDRNDWVEVKFERLTGQTRKAIFLEIEADEFSVGKSKIDNCDDLEADLERPLHKRTEDTITVPRWLAESNGWEVDD